MKLKISVLFVLLLNLVGTVRGAVITWTNTAGGSWQTATHWQPNQVPGPGDTALITTPGDYTVTLGGDVTVGSLTLGAASGHPVLRNPGRTLAVTGASVIEANGELVFQNGSVSGNITVALGGQFTFATTSTKSIQGLTLINSGKIFWDAGTLTTSPTTTITNIGVFEIDGDDDMTLVIGGVLPKIVNLGTLRKIGSNGTTLFSSVQFQNTGLVDVQRGTIQFNNMDSGLLGGTFTTTTGTTVRFNNGTFGDAGGVFNGTGAAIMAAGTLTLSTNILPGLALAGGTVQIGANFQNAGAITNLTLSGAKLVGTNEISGDMTIASGSMSGKLTVRSGGTLNFTTTGSKDLTTLTLINNGTVKWQGGQLGFGNTPPTVVTNNNLWEINSDASMTLIVGGPAPQFVNAASGTVRKIGGVGTTTITSIQFVNAGLVDVLQGTITFSGMNNAILGGTFTAGAGAVIQFTSGTYTENGAVFNGAGISRMTSGTLSLVNNSIPGLALNGGTVTISGSSFQNSGAITNLTISGGKLNGTYEVSGTLTVADGGITGNLTVRPGGTLVFSTASQKDLTQLTLNNNGTVKWNGGQLGFGNTPTTLCTNSGLWEINSDATLTLIVGGPAPVFYNAPSGTVRKIGGVGTTSFNSIQFINAGQVTAEQGAISFGGMENAILGGTFTAPAGAIIQLSSGTYSENGSVWNGGGTLRMSNGALTLVSNIMPGLSLNGGTVRILSSFQSAGAITNLTISGAKLIGTNEVAGNLFINDGGANGSLTVRNGGVLTFGTANSKDLTQLTLNNNGTVKWNGGQLGFGNTPTTLSTNTGLWEINSDATLTLIVGGPVPRFVNNASGTVRKIGGVGTTSFNNIQFINAGSVVAEQGVISFGGMENAILGGTFTAETGAIIQLTSGSYSENGAVWNGPGTVRMNSGALTLVNNIMPGLNLVGGTVTILGTFQDGGAITNLTISGSKLTGINEVSGNLNILDGGISGNLTVRSGGTLTFSTTGSKDLTQLTLNNNGTVKWLGGQLGFGNTPTTLCTNSGLWEINSDATLTLIVGGPVPRFVNTASGTVRKIGGVGTTSFNNVQVINAGAFETLSGTISFGGMDNASLGGTFTAAADTLIQLSSGTYNENGAVWSGAGGLRMANGTLTLVSNIMTGLSLNGGVVRILSTFQSAGAITNLTINGAKLTGTNEVAGDLIINDGGVNGNLTVRNGGTLTLTAGNSKDFTQLTLNNNGTVKWLGGQIGFGNSPTTLCTNSGLWEINSDASLTLIVGGPVPRFVNTASGTVRKIGGSGTTSFNNHQFINAGVVEALQGTISFGGMENAILGGNFNTANGANIVFSSGTYTENSGSTAGAVRMANGTLSLVTNNVTGLALNGGSIKVGANYQASGAITNLVIDGAYLAETNEVAGTLTVNSGGILGRITVRPTGTLIFTSSATKDLTRLTLINNGTVRWLDGNLGFGNTPTTLITNNSLFEMTGDNSMTLIVGGPNPIFSNAGTFRKTTGAGTTTLSSFSFVNTSSGVVEAQSGILRFPNNQTFATGTLRLNGGRLEASGTLTMSGGQLEGSGSIGLSLFTGGIISPGLGAVSGPGKINFLNGLRLSAGVTVKIDANNSTPGTGHDQLAVTGTVDLAGATLNLGTIAQLAVGTRLTFIDNDGSSDAPTNTFSAYPEGALFTHGFQLFRVRYTSGGNDVALVRDDGGVRLTSLTLLEDGTSHLTGLGTNNVDYAISATTNFTNWVDIGTVRSDSGGVFQIIDTNAALFNHRFYRSLGPGVSQ